MAGWLAGWPEPGWESKTTSRTNRTPWPLLQYSPTSPLLCQLRVPVGQITHLPCARAVADLSTCPSTKSCSVGAGGPYQMPMQPIDLFCWRCGGFRDDNLGYLQTRSFPRLRPRHSNRLVDAYELEPPRSDRWYRPWPRSILRVVYLIRLVR